MKSNSNTVDEYILELTEDKKSVIIKIREVLKNNLPKGFEEGMLYGMPTFYVPFSLYPKGYHCDTTKPLSFIGYASQKNFFAIYNMGLYSDSKLYDWLIEQWPIYSKKKIDGGKSCLRFKKEEDIPFQLIGQLATKMSPEQWIEIYESILLKSKSRSK